MDSFTDYYAVLGVEANAPLNAIKTAFKKLALQYHPDVYKGEDAEERMRVLLLAYQTLSDTDERRVYDVRYAEHLPGASSPRGYVSRDGLQTKRRGNSDDVTPTARRDRQRHYAFPELDASSMHSVHIDLGTLTYDLSPDEVRTLKQEGMLRGVSPDATSATVSTTTNNVSHYCHRCHHRWTSASAREAAVGNRKVCPSCQAQDWGEYLLLRCIHCHAVFESEQIRYEVGSYNYGDGKHCPPYELFPLCPYCGASNWCPAEDARLYVLRTKAARRDTILRIVWMCAAVIVIIIVAAALFGVLR